MKNLIRAIICTCFLALFAANTFANDYVKFKGWKQAETTHFRFIYEDASEEAAKKYAEFADEAWEKIARIYAMPQEKTNVYVFSRMNIVNAYTYFAPPEIIMYDSPILDSYFGFRDDWMKLFFTHELIHIANITFEDKTYLASKLFGESIRSMDYSSIPGWALEGLTTVLETELSNGGRGRSPYFELDYKAATLDNNFIPYRLIGTEQEPPYSQIYVMGYLIMRSIADRWGLQALADIERNRDLEHTWEESVKLVTGHTPQDIYREVKISLEKRYAKERSIPEGKIISPNNINQHYYTPAIIFDDGSLITVTSYGSDTNAVYYNPNEANDKKEKFLFSAYFDSYTADENKTVYYTSSVSRYDRNPGNETQFPIFKWTEEGGSVRITNDESSYYQLTVSRDGKVLVAVEQEGLKMRLVQIDTQTGAKTILFEDARYSFVQPALNADASELAFLLLKDDRACVALADMTTKQYKIVNNTDYDFITDPSYPSFNKDGTLNFCSNDRGRLEIFHASLNSDGQTFTCTPVVADPIGALWAYKNDLGIFYTSHASTGNVIKIKPVEEWGKVPDFEGPSPAGQIMTFGGLEDDYPDFKPFVKAAAQVAGKNAAEDETATEDSAEDSEAAENTEDSTSSNKETSDYKRRSQEKIDQLENLKPATKELTNQKRYFPAIQPFFYSPFINVINNQDHTYLGVGGVFLGMYPKLQMKTGLVWIDAFYYPTLKNFTGDFLAELPLATGLIDIFVSRNNLSFGSDENFFELRNMAILGYTLPIISRDEKDSSTLLNAITYAGFSMDQKAEKVFAVNADIPFTKQLSFHAGLDYSRRSAESSNASSWISIVNLALGNYDFATNKFNLGYEGEFSMKNGFDSFMQETSLIVRYTDFPSETVPTLSRAHFNGQEENCLFPGKAILNYAYIIPNILYGLGDLNFNVQGMLSFGKNSDGKTPETNLPLNIQIERKFSLGAELSVPLGLEQKLALGYSGLFEFNEGKMSKPQTKFYLTCKMNWLRF